MPVLAWSTHGMPVLASMLGRLMCWSQPGPEARTVAPTRDRGPMAGYPKEFEREMTLRDGARVRIRPVLPEDEPRLVALYGRLSPRTAHQRFFTVWKRLPSGWAHYFANVDYRRRLALVAERDLDWRPELIGVARYDASAEDTAEVAIVVQDYWQGKGLGRLLLEELLRAGEANGIRRFSADVLADNDRVLRMLPRVADIQERKTQDGVTTVRFTRRTAPPERPS